MTDEQRHMYEAWWFTLSREEQEEADYALKLPGGSHAVAYLAVRLMRAEAHWEALGEQVGALSQRSVWSGAAKALGVAGATLAALFTGWRSAQ